MTLRTSSRSVVVFAAALAAGTLSAAPPPKVEGSFVMAGVEAGLGHVRATRVALDEKTQGFAVLLSARPAEGEIASWRSADPAERGSFIFLMLEASGAVWVAELGHTAASGGRFGVMTEVGVTDFAVEGGRLTGHLVTNGEPTFFDQPYRVDLRFEAPLDE